jgi:hypothetical protein
MKIFLLILTTIWTSFWIYAGVGIFKDTPYQIEKDKEFIEKQINPCIDFVENFKIENNRLPNYREFYTWERDYFKDYTSDLKQEIDSLIPGMGSVQYLRSTYGIISNDLGKFKEANWRNDYAIGVWRGDWVEYYFSWNKTYDTNNYSWANGFSALITLTGIGLIPLVFWVIYLKKRKKAAHNIV